MSERDYILIRKYLTKELDQGQVNEVEQRMISDKEFGKTIEAFDLLMRGKKLEGKESEKDEIIPFDIGLSERLDAHYESQNDDERNPGQQNSGIINFTGLLKVAASVAILMLGSIWIYSSWFDLNPMDQLISGYAEVYFEVPVGRGIMDPWREDYKEGDYSNVIRTLAAKKELSNEEIFYLGLSYLYNDEYRQAVGQLSNVRLLRSNYSNHALWYLTLAYYLNSEEEEAIEIWEELSLDPTSNYNGDAQDALDEYRKKDE